MINSIIEAISVSLNREFGDSYEIHMEEIKQDLKEPCFFISCINSTTGLFLGIKYLQENQFLIQYFPESELDAQRECNKAAERMFWCLEYITVSGNDKPIRGTKVRYEVVDGVLSFFVNYDCFLCKVKEDEAMEVLETDTKMREGE